jgi:hypothetical protein
MRRTAALFLASVLVVACGGGSGLTDAEREWCTFSDDSADTAERFDLIFEAGLALQLSMDEVNATAAALRAQYESEGMSPGDAVAQVSQDLFDIDAFVEACQAAYAEIGSDVGS